MDRFRTNILIDNDEPWEEDLWESVEIGGIAFDLVKPCARCIMTTQDQVTGERIGGNPDPGARRKTHVRRPPRARRAFRLERGAARRGHDHPRRRDARREDAARPLADEDQLRRSTKTPLDVERGECFGARVLS